jgi:hypothetical protein
VIRRRRVHPEARAELRAAARWHDKHKPGLGDELLSAAETTDKDLALLPDQWAAVPDWEGEPTLRWRHITNFPYRVVYYSNEKHLNIIAYAHEKREPGYWYSRVSFWDSNPVKNVEKSAMGDSNP